MNHQQLASWIINLRRQNNFLPRNSDYTYHNKGVWTCPRYLNQGTQPNTSKECIPHRSFKLTGAQTYCMIYSKKLNSDCKWLFIWKYMVQMVCTTSTYRRKEQLPLPTTPGFRQPRQGRMAIRFRPSSGDSHNGNSVLQSPYIELSYNFYISLRVWLISALMKDVSSSWWNFHQVNNALIR